jgi:3-oxoacyl-[acyl-carrier protein] reductase
VQGTFAGKVAFITGGATGFGRAFAQAFSAQGATTVLADIDIAGAKKAAADLHRKEAAAIAVSCDVADEQSVERAVRTAIDQLGGVDYLINNAARHLKKYNQPFSSLTIAEIRGLFDVNVIGIINCSLACRRSMSERGDAAIVNMSSSGGFTSTTPYGVTKLAVRGLTIAFASEFSSDRIRVNAIAPVMTPTDSLLAEYTEEEIEQSVSTRQLIHRRATTDDVVNAGLYLCSPKASFITGETIRVTGGAAMYI